MRLPLASGRTPNGLWADFQHLEAELRRFATQQAEQQTQQAQQAAHQQAAQAAAAATQPVLGPWRQAQQQQAQQQAEDAAEEAEWLAAATADDRPQASAWLPPWHAAASSSSSSTPGGGGGSSNSSSSGGATTTTTATSSSSTSSSSTSSSPGGGLLATGRRNLRYASRSWSSSGLGPADVALPSITMLAEDGSAARSADVPLSGGSGSGSSGSGGSGSDADTPRGASGAGSAGSAGSAAGFGSSGGLVFLPTQQELREAGRSDLIAAIRTHGGSLAVARRLGWAVHYGRLPSEAAVVQQLLLFVQAVHGRRRPKTGLLPMPTLRQLQEGGRVDLAGAVQRLGGVGVFAALLAGEQRRRRRALRPGVGGGQRQRHGGATAEEEAEEEEEEEGGRGLRRSSCPTSWLTPAAAGGWRPRRRSRLWCMWGRRCCSSSRLAAGSGACPPSRCAEWVVGEGSGHLQVGGWPTCGSCNMCPPALRTGPTHLTPPLPFTLPPLLPGAAGGGTGGPARRHHSLRRRSKAGPAPAAALH